MDSSVSARRLTWLLAAGGLAFDIAAYYPGQMSFDSGYTWWQARVGETWNTQSPMLVHLWRVLDSIVPGPGLVFLLHLVLFWGGLMLIALGLRLRPLATVMLFALAGFAPLVTVLRAHVWTDVGFAAALLVSTGALAFLAQTGKRRWLLLVLVAGFYALGLRQNALPALLPVVVCAMHRALAHDGTKRGRLAVGVASTLVLAALFGAVRVINAHADRDVPVWPALAVYDLAALSIATDRVLLPAQMIGPAMDVADLKQAYQAWSVGAVLTRTRNGIRDPVTPGWTPAQLAELRHAWLGACLAHPREYVAHRIEMTAALFGTHPNDWPLALKFVPVPVQFRDNPPVPTNTTALHGWIFRTAERLRDTPMFAAWPYLLVGLVAAPFAWRRRDRPAARIALVLIASGALYALPLVVLVTSAEVRYTLWPCVASLVAGVLAFANVGSPSSVAAIRRSATPNRYAEMAPPRPRSRARRRHASIAAKSSAYQADKLRIACASSDRSTDAGLRCASTSSSGRRSVSGRPSRARTIAKSSARCSCSPMNSMSAPRERR